MPKTQTTCRGCRAGVDRFLHDQPKDCREAGCGVPSGTTCDVRVCVECGDQTSREKAQPRARFNAVRLRYTTVREPGLPAAIATHRAAYAFDYRDDRDFLHGAGLPLFLINEAWGRGCSFEDLADGFGPGRGTCGGDWSGIRDSGEDAQNRMLQRALNFLFPKQ